MRKKLYLRLNTGIVKQKILKKKMTLEAFSLPHMLLFFKASSQVPWEASYRM